MPPAVVAETATVFPLRSVLSGSREPARVTAVQPLAPVEPAATATLNPVDSSVAVTGTAAGHKLFPVHGGGRRRDRDRGASVRRHRAAGHTDAAGRHTRTSDTWCPAARWSSTHSPTIATRWVRSLRCSSSRQPADSPLTATVRDLHLVQVSSSRTVPPAGVTLTYTAANAAGGTPGQIRVVPVAAPTSPQPPVATDIAVTRPRGRRRHHPDRPVRDRSERRTVDRQTVLGRIRPARRSGIGVRHRVAIRYLAPATPPAPPSASATPWSTPISSPTPAR